MTLFTRSLLERMGVTTRSVQPKRRLRVKLHPNARTTPHMRALLVNRIAVLHWSVGEAAAAAGISVRSAYKWVARYRTAGPAGLADRSSAPHRQPRRTSAE